MTYKINPEVEKIKSPVRLICDDGTDKMFTSGKELADAVFDKHYNISSYTVRDGYLEICVYEFVEMSKN